MSARDNIEALYQENLSRPGDEGGVMYYADLMARGVTVGEIDKMMEASPEYRQKHGLPSPVAGSALSGLLPLLLIGGAVYFFMRRKKS